MQVVTVAGTPGVSGFRDGPASQALFTSPVGICCDSKGNVFAADASNHCIRKIEPNGTVSTFVGNPTQPGNLDGNGNAALFNFPNHITSDRHDNIYVSDANNHSIRKVSPFGQVTTVPGKQGSHPPFDRPYGVCVDSHGNVYVSDTRWVAVVFGTLSGTA